MKKYLFVFLTNIKEALMWRENLFVWIITNILTYAIFPFLFLAMYGTNTDLGGYTKPMLITYFIFIPLLDALTLSYAWDEIGKHVREGAIGQHLTKPISYLGYLFFGESGAKIIRLLISFLVVIVLLPFARNLIIFPTLSLEKLILFCISLFFGIGLGFLTASAIGLISFWTTRTDWALHGWWALQTFAAGYVAPTTLYPEKFQTIIAYLPYSLLIETPIRILLGTIAVPDIVHRYIVGSVWLILLLGLNTIIWRRGVRRIDVVGI